MRMLVAATVIAALATMTPPAYAQTQPPAAPEERPGALAREAIDKMMRALQLAIEIGGGGPGVPGGRPALSRRYGDGRGGSNSNDDDRQGGAHMANTTRFPRTWGAVHDRADPAETAPVIT